MTIRLGAALAIFAMCVGNAQDATPVIKVCKAGYRAPHTTYAMSVDWGARPITRGGHIVVGAQDSSTAIWIQATIGRLHGDGEESVTFNVSDNSGYPLEFGIYRLSDETYQDYQRACGQGQCFVSPDSPGVELLTTVKTVRSSATANDC